MTWNWEKPEWPRFEFDSKQLEALEAKFLHHPTASALLAFHAHNDAL